MMKINMNKEEILKELDLSEEDYENLKKRNKKFI